MHKVNPQTGALLEAGRIWTSGVSGQAGKFVAFQIAIERDAVGHRSHRREAVFAECKLPAVLKDRSGAALREWMVPDDKDASDRAPRYPDVLPLAGSRRLPATANVPPAVQPVFVDIIYRTMPRQASITEASKCDSLLHTIRWM